MGFWYGVVMNKEDDDWSCGSYDLAEAEAMVARFKAEGCVDAYIKEDRGMALWYAVMQDNEDDDWSCGSYDLAEAEAMVARFKAEGCVDAYIAVIDEGGDPICVEEIRE